MIAETIAPAVPKKHIVALKVYDFVQFFDFLANHGNWKAFQESHGVPQISILTSGIIYEDEFKSYAVRACNLGLQAFSM